MGRPIAAVAIAQALRNPLREIVLGIPPKKRLLFMVPSSLSGFSFLFDFRGV
jgi:hypothetical protein